tara:strand:+ start:355 stop:633 length:279 start_codon:yes stop_codon:yes gene_type:complete
MAVAIDAMRVCTKLKAGTLSVRTATAATGHVDSEEGNSVGHHEGAIFGEVLGIGAAARYVRQIGAESVAVVLGECIDFIFGENGVHIFGDIR